MPVLIAPTAFHRLVHDQGETATARAALATNTIMIMSMASTETIEKVAAASEGRTWLQLYLQPDLSVTESFVRRAEDSGCKALVITVDSPVFGRRERDVRNGFTDLPPGLVCENLRVPSNGEPESRVRSIAFSTKLSWREVEWLRDLLRSSRTWRGCAACPQRCRKPAPRKRRRFDGVTPRGVTAILRLRRRTTLSTTSMQA